MSPKGVRSRSQSTVERSHKAQKPSGQELVSLQRSCGVVEGAAKWRIYLFEPGLYHLGAVYLIQASNYAFSLSGPSFLAHSLRAKSQRVAEGYEKKKNFCFWFSPILEHFDRFVCFYFSNAKFIEKQPFSRSYLAT